MTGKLYITNSSGVYVDVYKEFGVFLTKGSYANLIAFPPLKKLETNNWPEEDGEEVDLYNPALEGREFLLSFGAKNKTHTGDFLTLLSDMAYHDFRFTELGRKYTLRLVSMQDNNYMQGAETFSLKFADDSPYNFDLAGDTFQGELAPRKTGYELDGKDLSEYGVSVLKGSLGEVTKAPAVKKNMSTNYTTKSGVGYDGRGVFYEPKDVTLKCCMIVPTIERFWSNYDALLRDLISVDNPEGSAGRNLVVEDMGEEYECYYKDSSVNYFATDGGVWCEFTLTLTFTSFRVAGSDYVLTSEDGVMILTENDYLIDIR